MLRKKITLKKPLSADPSVKQSVLPKKIPSKGVDKDSTHLKAQQIYKRTLKIIKWLQEQYPLVFNRQEPKPLKRGMTKDVLAQGPFPYSNKNIRLALRLYTHFKQYHEAVMSHDHRYDLEGTPVELVTEAEKAYSQIQLDARNLKEIKDK